MPFFRPFFGAFFGLFFLTQTAFSQDPKSPQNAPAPLPDSMNPRLEAELLKQTAVVRAELKKLQDIYEKDTTGYFTTALNDTLELASASLNELVYSLLPGRTVWPQDSSFIDEESSNEDVDSSSVDVFSSSDDSTFSKLFQPKKSNRTIFSWGYSWGAADVIGSANLAGSATAKAPDFDFVQSRHNRFALLLRTRLGKRDTSQNVDFSGGGKVYKLQ